MAFFRVYCKHNMALAMLRSLVGSEMCIFFFFKQKTAYEISACLVGSAVHRIFMEKLAQKRVSMLSDKYNRGEQILLEDILEALGQEDVLAIEVMETVGHTLGKAMAGLINLFNPDLIVLGGTLAVAKDYIMLPLKSAINKYSLQLVNKDTTIKLSKLGEKAGAVGACMLSRSKMLGLM